MEVDEDVQDTFIEEVGEEQLEAIVRRRSSARFSLETASSLPTLAALKKSDIRTVIWGRGDFGQLGNGSTENVIAPQMNEEHLSDRDVCYADGNLFNSAVVTGDGEVFTMGSNTMSQLGQKISTDMILVPYRVAALENFRVAQIACGEEYMVAVTEVGQLASWGMNDSGQLGHGRKDDATTVSKPSIIRSVDELNFVRVAAGQQHTLALTAGGQVVSFGNGTFGALGHGNQYNVTQPLMVDGLWEIGVIQISCGENHSAALSADGKLFTWGHGKYGQLGFECQMCNTPRQVVFPPHVTITQISCGGNHTLALAKKENGETTVFSWGQGNWGQTGLGHNNNTHTPTIIPQFHNLNIAQISAGLRHSLVLTRDNKLFVFGNNEEGQLGVHLNDNQFVNQPTLVSGFDGLLILFVQATGEHSIAVVQKLQNSKNSGDLISGPLLQGRSQGVRTLPHELPSLLEVINHANETKEFAHMNRVVEDVFQSPGLLLAGFMDIKNTNLNDDDMDIDNVNSNSKNQYLSHNLDLNAISLIYRKLDNQENRKIVTHLGQACLRVLYQVQALLDDQKVDMHFSMRQLLILIQNPFNSKQKILEDEMLGPQLLLLYLGVIRQFQQQKNNFEIFKRWLHELSPEVFARDLVKATLENLTYIGRTFSWVDARRQIKPMLDLLKIFYEVSTQNGKDLIPFHLFHCKEISKLGILQQEYDFFVRRQFQFQQQNINGYWSMLDYSFVLTPEAKSQYVKFEAQMEQQTQFRESTVQALFRGEGLYRMHSIGFFSLRIRRSDVMRDALTKILNSNPSDFKKKLRVKFVSDDVEEPGQDEGGLTKEFFQLLTKDLFDVAYGMFSYDEETRTYWFRNINILDEEQKLEFRLVGILFGLAIYNGVQIDVHFPLVVYKKLLGQQPTFDDLKRAFPQLGNGLQQLLDFEGDVENTFVRDFTIQYNCFEEVITKELKPDGANIPVTNENREEYVQAYTDFVLTDSIQQQFEAFSAGFQKVCSIGKNSILSLLRAEELEQLVCGLPIYEFKALEKNTKYEGGYSPDHPSIKMFWEIINELSLSQKKKFLSFTTGSDRAPIGGLGTMNFIIQRGGPDTEKLPTSHTCFNIILLPQYSSKEKMKQKLLTAIENAQGFGLR